MREVQFTVFRYEELSSEAKLKARQEFSAWLMRVGVINDDIQEFYKDYLVERGLPVTDIEFSLSSAQGDGMAFYGHIDSETVAPYVVGADELSKVREVLKGINITIKRNNLGRHYSHYNTMTVDHTYVPLRGYEEQIMQDFIKRLEGFIKDTSKHLEAIGYAMIEEQLSDENIISGIEFGNWGFTEDGAYWDTYTE